ncbi:MAG: saccharopine dehydrogenase NADP-binding domain-containing protein [Myxococcaceae bacterium]|nr:saccharopine dehydrogenase NADP-binding domain-containing protein [Myxococcaceae bacterium]
MSTRPWDIVVFGATGFTGALVAEYLASNAPAHLRIALAGRNADKLEGVRRSLGGAGARFGALRADTSDAASVHSLASQARVVCTTVGPYAKYGLPLVEACARAGTHLCDLTGEVQFMRRSIDAFDGVARSTGARIVHACGFDSIPSDLGMATVHDFVKREGGSGQLVRATFAVVKLKGAASGGTVASMLNAVEEATADRAVRRLFADPYALSPDRSKEADLGRQRDLTSLRYDDFLGGWTAPFMMASVNTRVVRRSNALLDYAWGQRLDYREVSLLRPGFKGLLFGAGMTAGLAALVASQLFTPTRDLVRRRLPQPGEGPDRARREAGSFRVRIEAETVEGRRVTGTVAGTSDPGYGETSKMLSQAALCLAQDEASLPERAGVLTPATAMGMTLVERLRRAGMTFDATWATAR